MGYEFLANCALLSPLKKKKKELTSLTNVDIPVRGEEGSKILCTYEI